MSNKFKYLSIICFLVFQQCFSQTAYDSISRFSIGLFAPKFDEIKYYRDQNINFATFEMDPSTGFFLGARILQYKNHGINFEFRTYKMRSRLKSNFTVVDVVSGLPRESMFFMPSRQAVTNYEVGLSYNYRQKITNYMSVNFYAGVSYERNGNSESVISQSFFSDENWVEYQRPFFSYTEYRTSVSRYNFKISVNYLLNCGEVGLYLEQNRNWKSRYINGQFEVFDDIEPSNRNFGIFDNDGDYYSFGLTFTPRKGFLKKKKQ
ncbi:hypothetical protein [Flavobacterium sp.]|uniref:hypothetical protein n=1 Tax=Flavobacterium sp. TaxID=239 RepID=UPI0026310348|nr:hypothetical protein [Flavobacterium sp.]